MDNNKLKKIQTSSGGGYAPITNEVPIAKLKPIETVAQRQARQRAQRAEELKYTDADEARWARNRQRALAARERTDRAVIPQPIPPAKERSFISKVLKDERKRPTDIVAYCWINRTARLHEDNKIPCDETTHGLQTVINNAKLTPKVNHVIYIGRYREGTTTIDPKLSIPPNVRLCKVQDLISRVQFDKPETKQKFMEMYDATWENGHPAFVRNFISLAAQADQQYFLDIGVNMTEGGDLANHLNTKTAQRQPVGNGSFIMGGHSNAAVSMVVNFMHDIYTKPKGLNPKKAVEFLESIDPKTPPLLVVKLLKQNCKSTEALNCNQFVIYSERMEKMLSDFRVHRNDSEYARHVDAVFGNCVKILANRVAFNFEGYTNNHKASHIKTPRKRTLTG